MTSVPHCDAKGVSYEWDRYVQDGIAALPCFFRDKIVNVAVLLEDEPSVVVRHEQQLRKDETLLGLYHGVPLPDRGEGYGVGAPVPDTISIYKIPTIEAGHNDAQEVARIVRETIWHEFGHYFGLDEGEVQHREKERGVDLA